MEVVYKQPTAATRPRKSHPLKSHPVMEVDGSDDFPDFNSATFQFYIRQFSVVFKAQLTLQFLIGDTQGSLNGTHFGGYPT